MVNSLVWLFGCVTSLTLFTYAGVNLDRLILCSLFISCIILNNKVFLDKEKFSIISFSTLWYVYVLTYLLYANEKSDIFRYIFAYVYIPIVFYLGYILRCIDTDRYKLERMLKCWLLLFCLFFIYTYYNYFWLKNYHLSILSVFSIDSVNHFKQARALRNFLPFFSAPHLASVSGFIFVYFYLFGKDKRRKLYSFVAFGVVLSTLSRGPLVSIVLVCTFYFLYRLLQGRVYYNLLIYPLVASLCLLYFNTDDIRVVSKLLTILDGRHFTLRSDTISAISDFDLKSHFLGMGIGSFPYYIDGDYSFTSFLTVYFEMGVLGLILFSLFYLSYFLNTIIKKINLCRINVFLVTYIIFVNLFYEVKTLLPLYFLLGYFYIENPKNRNQNLKKQESKQIKM